MGRVVVFLFNIGIIALLQSLILGGYICVVFIFEWSIRTLCSNDLPRWLAIWLDGIPTYSPRFVVDRPAPFVAVRSWVPSQTRRCLAQKRWRSQRYSVCGTIGPRESHEGGWQRYYKQRESQFCLLIIENDMVNCNYENVCDYQRGWRGGGWVLHIYLCFVKSTNHANYVI